MARKYNSVREYMDALPAPLKKMATTLRKTITDAAPDAEELISYNMPAYKWNGFLVSFAVWKEHIGLYPRTGAMEIAIKELSRYEGEKGTIRFPIDKPLPLPLIRRIVQFRIKENAGKKK